MDSRNEYKIVLVNGCFDLFHYGHLLHLEEAKKMGDRLVVSVTSDKYVNKGPGRPVFSEDQRAEVLKSLRCVDQVIIVDSSIEALKKIMPDIFVKGADYVVSFDERVHNLDKMRKEDVDFCVDNGIEIKFTYTKKYSSTELIKNYEPELS